jgi:hypothetical protein
MARLCKGKAGLLSPAPKGPLPGQPRSACCSGLGIHPTDTLVPSVCILRGKERRNQE